MTSARTTTSGAGKSVPSHPALGASFAGELIGPDHADYDQARKICNGMIDKRPALIARCTSPGDVQGALAYARARHMIVAVRGGGHSTPGYSSCDGGVVIDTGPMKHIEIDVERRTGRFGAGLTWGELDVSTEEHGLAVTGGRVTHTGIAGLTLGSGSGWLERKYGITCASLLSAEVVTAEGQVLRASADENADLFWGLRGGGGNFGVVTEFEFRLHPVGPIVFGGMILHPRAVAAQLARFYRDFMEEAPDEVGGGLALISAPPEEFVPEHARGKPACGLIVLYVGDPQAGEQALRPLLEWGDPWLEMVQPMPYPALQQLLDAANPWGINEYAKIDYLPELPDEAIDTMMLQAAEASSPFTEVILCPLGGAVSRMDRRTMALNIPNTKWMYFCMAKWWDPTEQENELAWARAFMEAMRPWSVDKAPPNFLHPDEGAGRLRASYGEEKFRRLVALKDKYDPENVFSLNANVPPSATQGSASPHARGPLAARANYPRKGEPHGRHEPG
jgi:FAD/FMN-containing dehydrogenase